MGSGTAKNSKERSGPVYISGYVVIKVSYFGVFLYIQNATTENTIFGSQAASNG